MRFPLKKIYEKIFIVNLEKFAKNSWKIIDRNP